MAGHAGEGTEDPVTQVLTSGTFVSIKGRGAVPMVLMEAGLGP